MTDSKVFSREIDRLSAMIRLLSEALMAQQEENAAMRAERDQLCGALTQANLQMTQMMRFLRERRGQTFEISTVPAHSIH